MRMLLQVWMMLMVMFAAKAVVAQDSAAKARMTGEALRWSVNNGRFRQSMEALPKGADLHSHLRGAVYAESWLDWAAADGLCADMEAEALKFKEKTTCETSGWITAVDARANESTRRTLINSMSTRSYVPTLNWSGHNDFFATFEKIAVAPHRLGDQLAEVAERAGYQNILYLELMETIVLPELFPLVGDIKLTGDMSRDYQALMKSPFGAEIPALVSSVQKQLTAAYDRKNKVLGCDMNSGATGCDVEIRFLHQVIREFEPAMVFAQIILGWAVMDEVENVVGLNLVAPEDGFRALRDYSQHMQMIDYLYSNHGEHNISLHAGELVLGLVRPHQLRFHMREAIEVGHAKRIGHGISIDYEDDSSGLVQKMVDEDIMVEINLTSNDTILGVSGAQHPIVMYRDKEVPYALSTDDEGVSRIDLTHEYMRFFRDYNIPYFEMKHGSRNSLTYSFLSGTSLWDNAECVKDIKNTGVASASCAQFLETSKKAQLQWKLEENFQAYENTLRIPKRKKTSFQ